MPMFAVVLAGMVTSGKITIDFWFLIKLIPIRTELSVESVRFLIDILQRLNTKSGVEWSIVSSTVTLHLVGTAGATKVLDEGFQ